MMGDTVIRIHLLTYTLKGGVDIWSSEYEKTIKNR